MVLLSALTVGLVFFICGWALGLGSTVSWVVAAAILGAGIVAHVLQPGGR